MITKRDKNAFLRDYRRLLNLASKKYDDDKELSERYSYIAYRMLLSKKLKPPRGEKVLICRHCTKILIPGKTMSVRLYKGMITYKCRSCGNTRKLMYDKRIRRKSD
ncbi:hypothetical protein M1293_03475 [Candidatus Parvarchaeota archaeon]|nr:hypothetical protein [Candidatus Parvarchaeota archaeon]